MNFKQYINITLKESSIHGFPYLVRKDLHWCEKLFWAIAIISATIISINICWGQWKRFRDNPIVYGMELVYGNVEYPFVGITLCSNFSNEVDLLNIIQNTWNVELEDNTTILYYSKFLKTLNALNVYTLSRLEAYEKDETLNNLDYYNILLQMKSQIMPEKLLTENAAEEANVDSGSDKITLQFAAAITEFGLCKTTSLLTNYTNPYGDLKSLYVSPAHSCDIINTCQTKILIQKRDPRIYIFMHSIYDVLTKDKSNHLSSEGSLKSAISTELMLGMTTSEAEVRNLPIAYRKCRYADENNLKYFSNYGPNLCNLECRIDAAVEKCGCKPYFYAMAPHLPICSIKGMMCLHRTNWLKSTNCRCMPLCQEISYIKLQTTVMSQEGVVYQGIFNVKMQLPRLATKRRVIFSTDQLIVSFGGAIGLFLGASFISIYGLIYLFIKFIFSNLYLCLRRCFSTRTMNRENHIRNNSDIRHFY